MSNVFKLKDGSLYQPTRSRKFELIADLQAEFTGPAYQIALAELNAKPDIPGAHEAARREAAIQLVRYHWNPQEEYPILEQLQVEKNEPFTIQVPENTSPGSAHGLTVAFYNFILPPVLREPSGQYYNNGDPVMKARVGSLDDIPTNQRPQGVPRILIFQGLRGNIHPVFNFAKRSSDLANFIQAE